MHCLVAQISLPFWWLRAPVYVLDLALFGVPFVRCVSLKFIIFLIPSFAATAPYSLLHLLLHASSLGLSAAMFIAYT